MGQLVELNQYNELPNPIPDGDDSKFSADANTLLPPPTESADSEDTADGPVRGMGARYEIRNGYLYKNDDKGEELVANFWLEISSQRQHIDDGTQLGQDIDLVLHVAGEELPFTVTSDVFASAGLMRTIYQVGGAKPILYGKVKDIRIAAQEVIQGCISTKTVVTSIGFNSDGHYVSPGMLITPAGITVSQDIRVDLTGSNSAKHLGFLPPEPVRLRALARHLIDDFLDLKSHSMTFPLIGHVVLAPFASWIERGSGKQKPAMHCQGPSGSGKTFVGNLAMSFFGRYHESSCSWSSTANAIEAAGYYFRDSLILIDDLKPVTADRNKVIRIIQGYADGQGRSRLNSNQRLAKTLYIRGLILSTGEEFVSDVESVLGRTIVLSVRPEQNLRAGETCWNRRGEYRMFMPGLLAWVISQPDWEQSFKRIVDRWLIALSQEVVGLPNGFRIASNWALNALGFNLFVRYARELGAVDDQRMHEIAHEYAQIVSRHLSAHSGKIREQNPVEVFFATLGLRLAVGTCRIQGLKTGPSNGGSRKIIGKYNQAEMRISIFPDLVFEILAAHFRAAGQTMPFGKTALRDALVHQHLIIKSGSGRISTQVRLFGTRVQAWQFDADEFRRRCGLIQNDESLLATLQR